MLSTVLSAILIINELMASNAGKVMSPATNFDSWIELYNPGDNAVNLGEMTLSDSQGHRWQMPADMGSVPAGGFKVVWLGSNEIKTNQATFNLDCDGGTIILTDKDGTVVASESYPEALSRTAWARKTDGGNEWGWTDTPTPEATNATSQFATQRLDPPVVSVGSKLFTGSLTVKVNIPEGTRLAYTTDGSLPIAPDAIPSEDPWTERVKNGDCEGEDASCLVSKNGDSSQLVNRITDGVGVDGSRGVKVHSIKNASKDNTTQFFVYTPDHIWQTGEQYLFTMKVRADKAAKIKAFAQKKPGEDITKSSGGWWGGGSSTPVSMLDETYEVTTEWKVITCKGTITADQAGEQWDWWSGGAATYSLQTIAFNLNISKSQDNNFYFDDISWQSLPIGYTEFPTKESLDGQFTVTKTTSLTLRLFQDGYLPSVPVTRSYIMTSNNYTLPVISIVGDKRYFTDPKIGFDCDGDGTNGKTGNGQDTPRNYNQPWDRPVNFSYIGTDGKMAFNQDVNISVSGGWTRSQRFRSFKLKSNKVFDGQNRFDFSFFPQKPYIRSKTILLRNGGNDIWVHNARFMDPALETIIQRSGIDLDVQSYVPIIEYVNGELRGVLNMREPNNDKFAYANWGYDDEELDAFENLQFKNGDNIVINRIFELGQHINEAGAYDELKTLLDIDEFTNYMAATMFLDNDDWPNNNIKAYRSRNDGRYRFVSFDLDYAFALRGFNQKNDDPFSYFLQFKDAETVSGEGNPNREIVRLFLNLLGHDDYRRKFIDTFCLMGGSVFEPTRAGKIVDELLDKVNAVCQLMKQQGIYDGHEPDRAASTIKNKLKGRSSQMAGYLKKFSYAKLNNVNAQNVTLKTDTEGARLFINGINVPYADFQGSLFGPVRLEAQAPSGYCFAGWNQNGTILSTEAAIDLPAASTLTLTATFTKLSDDDLAAQGVTPVRINEVSAANGIHVNDYFKRNDWVELYNTTDHPVDVEGMYLSDNAKKPTKYQITRGESNASTIIPAHGYLVIWCDKLEPVSQLHASFKLAAEGGDVLLTAADESWSDQLTYTALASDQTAGRYPDGTANVIQMNVPTIAQTNLTSSYADAIEQPTTALSVLHMPLASFTVRYVVGALAIHAPADAAAEDLRVNIVNLTGQSMERLTTRLSTGYAEVSLRHLPAGVYIATVTDGKGNTVSCKFAKK